MQTRCKKHKMYLHQALRTGFNVDYDFRCENCPRVYQVPGYHFWGFTYVVLYDKDDRPQYYKVRTRP